MDHTRKFDLLELYDDLKKEPTSSGKERIKKLMFDITNISPSLARVRGELMMAVRNKDRRHVEQCQREIRYILSEQYHGHKQL